MPGTRGRQPLEAQAQPGERPQAGARRRQPSRRRQSPNFRFKSLSITVLSGIPIFWVKSVQEVPESPFPAVTGIRSPRARCTPSHPRRAADARFPFLFERRPGFRQTLGAVNVDRSPKGLPRTFVTLLPSLSSWRVWSVQVLMSALMHSGGRA